MEMSFGNPKTMFRTCESSLGTSQQTENQTQYLNEESFWILISYNHSITDIITYYLNITICW